MENAGSPAPVFTEVESFLAPVIKGDFEEKEWTPAGSWS